VESRLVTIVLVLESVALAIAIILVLTGLMSSSPLILIISLCLAALGILFLSGHGSSLIAGYNTASKEEKALYNVKAIQRFIGILLMVIVALILLTVLAADNGIGWLSTLSYVVFLLVTLSGIVYLSVGKTFRDNGS
jgi:hypothetical protein